MTHDAALEPSLDRLVAALRGRYAVLRRLGQGGMGVVYLARDIKLGRDVAIKVLPPHVRAALGSERFEREVQLISRLSHPHIVSLFEADDVDGILFFVMEYVEGESLQQRLARGGPMALDEALRITAEVGDALQHAHDHGTVHRDVKPANILLSAGHALLADFGIAKSVTPDSGQTLTSTGVAIGTAPYMSPEQAGGERRVDSRSDVYALAAVLYEMLAGEPPITGPSVQAIVARILADRPRSIRTIRPAIPPHVEETLASALEKVPADRPPSARAFVDRVLQPAASRRVRLRGRHWLIAAGGIAVAVVLLATLKGGGSPAPPPGMVLVSGGTFSLFGGDCPWCLPPRDVVLDAFFIDRTEVSVAAYARYVSAGHAPAPWRARPADSLPATAMFWAEAAGYCRWRDPRTRLPTEEEWEAAARGPLGLPYPWGSIWEVGRANAAQPRAGLASVGMFPAGASAAGVLDLIGNAWEWTSARAESEYVIRGGAYNSPMSVANGLYRASLPPLTPESLRQANYGNTGFRCARPLR